jgi:tRNA modification GTPase
VHRLQFDAQALGGLASQAERWRETLISLRAEVEARLDFADEGDVCAELPSDFEVKLDTLRSGMRLAVAGSVRGEKLRDGMAVAICGAPNAGKSTLLNALAGREVAIVDAEPGTTRDVLEARLDLDGYPVRLFDTAGIRDAISSAERKGVARAVAVATDADLVIWCQDCTGKVQDPCGLTSAPVWRVLTKADLGKAPEGASSISALSGEGIPALLKRLGKVARETFAGTSSLVTNARQRDAIEDAVGALDGVSLLEGEIAAELLRRAGDAIARLSGRIDVEDVLDRVFAGFCIGK